MNFVLHQLNVANLKDDINLIRDLLINPENVLIGLEVTIPNINKLLNFNIDPQHGWNGKKDYARKITCLEKMMEVLPYLKPFQSKIVHLFFLKTDLDSISAAGILDIYLNTDLIFTPKMNERIKVIADYDRHGRDTLFLTDQQSIRIPRGLFMFISGWKNSLEQKVEAAKKWIINGTFDGLSDFNRIANHNAREAINFSKVQIIIPRKLVFVRSIKRGACGIGYKFAPIVIALNPSYRYGFGESRVYGKKWIIGQMNDKFINLTKLVRLIEKQERGWGGSSTIIGSPQDRPSKLTKNEVIDFVKNQVS